MTKAYAWNLDANSKEYDVRESCLFYGSITFCPMYTFGGTHFQAAVPKSMTLNMLPSASADSSIDNLTSSSITQAMHVTLASQPASMPRRPLAVRLRISFTDTITGTQVTDDAVVKNFPEGY